MCHNSFHSTIPTVLYDNGLSPVSHQATIWTNAGLSLIGPSGIKFRIFFIYKSRSQGIAQNSQLWILLNPINLFFNFCFRPAAAQKFVAEGIMSVDGEWSRWPCRVLSSHMLIQLKVPGIAHGIRHTSPWNVFSHNEPDILTPRLHFLADNYHNICNIRCTKSQSLNDSHLVLHLPLPNPLKPVIKLRMEL